MTTMPMLLLHLQTPRLGSHLEQRHRRRVVDPDRRVAQNSRGAAEANEFVVVQLAFAQPLRIDATFGSEKSLHQLLLAHFEREERDRHVVVERCILRDVENERGLSH